MPTLPMYMETDPIAVMMSPWNYYIWSYTTNIPLYIQIIQLDDVTINYKNLALAALNMAAWHVADVGDGNFHILSLIMRWP